MFRSNEIMILQIFCELLLVLTSLFTAVFAYNDTTGDQLITIKINNPAPIGIMTTTSGFPVSLEDTQTINSGLIFNDFFMESITHLNRERRPPRVVHAKGTRALGYFQVTHALSDICKAKVFGTVGKITPIVTRFSPVFADKGGSDVERDSRGFAIKFYTEEGNYDLAGLNIESFAIKDPALFSAFTHVNRPNPKTQVKDPNSSWDFNTLHPEILNTLMILFGDRGIPDGYRFMPSFGIHTFEFLNAVGDRNFVRIHILPDGGIKTLTTAEAKKIRSEDLDYANRDLYNAIERQDYPTWTFAVQVIPLKDVNKAKFDIFDVTKRWPLKEYPLRPVGKIVLNQNPENQFAEIEQLAFNPGNLVPGIRGIDDLFKARVFSYRDANNYRSGPNFNKIRVNCPFRTEVNSYVRDGSPPLKDNGGESPNYYPNSFHGPEPYEERNEPPRITVFTDPAPTNFDQASDFYNEMSDGEKHRLVETIVTSLREVDKFLQERAVKLYKIVNLNLGIRIENGLSN